METSTPCEIGSRAAREIRTSYSLILFFVTARSYTLYSLIRRHRVEAIARMRCASYWLTALTRIARRAVSKIRP